MRPEIELPGPELPTMAVKTDLRKTPLLAWFIGFGVLDMAIACLFAYGLHVQSRILLFLLPALRLFGDDPSNPGGLMVFLILFGGSFVAWGLAGVLVGLFVHLAVRSPAAKI